MMLRSRLRKLVVSGPFIRIRNTSGKEVWETDV